MNIIFYVKETGERFSSADDGLPDHYRLCEHHRVDASNLYINSEGQVVYAQRYYGGFEFEEPVELGWMLPS